MFVPLKLIQAGFSLSADGMQPELLFEYIMPFLIASRNRAAPVRELSVLSAYLTAKRM
jgi:hypothetical protein